MPSWNIERTKCFTKKIVKKSKIKDLRTRQYKNQRKLFNSVKENQSRIPSYFKIISSIQMVLNENKILYETIHNLQDELNNKNDKEKSTSEILNLLIQSAQNNVNKKSGGFRYAETLKEFGSYIFMLAGRVAYETLCKNIPLPSISSVSRYLQQQGPTIIEGRLRCKELFDYLQTRKLPVHIYGYLKMQQG